MNAEQFKSLLDALPLADWQRIIDGEALVVINDHALDVGAADALNACLDAGQHSDAQALRTATLADAESLYDNYYRTHALTRTGFDRQAQALLDEHGPENFAGPFGPPPPRTLFVDGGEVIAADASNPRHRYGAYCELDNPLAPEAAAEKVRRWLASGEAHQRYMSMNACRYNC
ncbi:MAG: hypothetical protein ACPGU7_12015 [Gammaproteobacteria bacterium]